MNKFLAHRIEDVEEYLKNYNIKYELIEVNNPKGVKIGEEKG
ncbi:hypothetical protein PL321_16890 [Caloramator sp. mosi_1]|nr:hypothetical protein [Caloramator sp. mosi_1]WDC84013.1 hypothetical protein PL321_16890 [Caloramator sp. mosi_1]